MTEKRSRHEAFKATAAHRMETLISLSLPFAGPNGTANWDRRTRKARMQLATEILLAPSNEVAEAQEFLGHKIFTTNSPFSSLALRVTVMNIFAEAGLEIVKKKGKVEESLANLPKKP